MVNRKCVCQTKSRTLTSARRRSKEAENKPVREVEWTQETECQDSNELSPKAGQEHPREERSVGFGVQDLGALQAETGFQEKEEKGWVLKKLR